MSPARQLMDEVVRIVAQQIAAYVVEYVMNEHPITCKTCKFWKLDANSKAIGLCRSRAANAFIQNTLPGEDVRTLAGFRCSSAVRLSQVLGKKGEGNPGQTGPGVPALQGIGPRY